jgi:hypothetical protein
VASITDRKLISINTLEEGWVITTQPSLFLGRVVDILGVNTKIRLTREKSLIAICDYPVGECPWLI